MPQSPNTTRADPELDLAQQTCRPMEGSVALTPQQVDEHLRELPGWVVIDRTLTKRFEFVDFARTIEFVNAVAAFAQSQDHHPELRVRSVDCTVIWTTHDVDGLSMNDFICAARTDRQC